MTERERIQWALNELNPSTDRIVNYAAYDAYYFGEHNLAFASEKFKSTFWDVFKSFSLNLCSSVVDIQAERLEIVGFTSSAAKVDTTGDTSDDESIDAGSGPVIVDDRQGSKAWDAWESNRLDLVADRIHTDALKYGDAFLIAATENGKVRGVWPQSVYQMAVHYGNDVPATIDLAAKLYGQPVGVEAKQILWTLYLYEPGVVTTYTAQLNADARPDSERVFGRIKRQRFQTDLMPVYHFPNKALAAYGASELIDVLPIQDATNKTVIDMLVASEYQAFRQRWATGAELDELPDHADDIVVDPIRVYTDSDGNVVTRKDAPEHGPGTLLMFPNPETKVGEFGQADVSPFVQVKNAFQADVARVSGVPLSYFFVSTSETPSGEALKAAEIRFQRKGRRQKRAFGNEWEHVVAAIANVRPTVDLNAVWMDDSPRNETEKLNALVLKQTMGVPPSALQKEMGYDDDEIKAFAKAVKALAPDVPKPNPNNVVPLPKGPNPNPNPDAA